MKRAHHAQRGFSFVEMLVVIALFTTTMLVITNGISSFYSFNTYTIAQSYQVSNATQGMTQLVRDLREMTYADNGAFPLVIMEKNKVGFYSDIDRDSSVEYIEYSLSTTTSVFTKKIFNATGTPLRYSATGTPDSTIILSEYVQNSIQNIPIFLYYDMNGALAATGTPAIDIRYMKLSIIVNIDPIRDPGQFMLRSSTALRNLKNTP